MTRLLLRHHKLVYELLLTILLIFILFLHQNPPWKTNCRAGFGCLFIRPIYKPTFHLCGINSILLKIVHYRHHSREGKCTCHYIRVEVVETLILDTTRRVSEYARSNEAEFIERVRQESVLQQETSVKDNKKALPKPNVPRFLRALLLKGSLPRAFRRIGKLPFNSTVILLGKNTAFCLSVALFISRDRSASSVSCASGICRNGLGSKNPHGSDFCRQKGFVSCGRLF